MTKHARLSPSASHTWMRCAAAVPLAELMGLKSRESPAAAFGTATHELAAECLEQGGTPRSRLGKTYYGHVADERMVEMAEIFVAYCRSLNSDISFVERKVWFPTVDGCGGTGDFISYDRSEATVEIVDLKTGQGKVTAKRNPQLMIYGTGAYEEFVLLEPIERIKATIVQPSLNHLDSYEFTPEELHAFVQEVTRAAFRISLAAEEFAKTGRTDNLEHYNPGEKQCRFCACARVCPALQASAQSMAVAEFSPLVEDDDLARWLDIAEPVKAFIKAVEAEAFERAVRGERVPGRKLIEGRRPDRAWRDETALKLELGVMFDEDKFMQPGKLMSPAQLEKALKNEDFDIKPYLAERGRGKPVLVPEDDPKPEYDPTASAASDFAEFGGDEE